MHREKADWHCGREEGLLQGIKHIDVVIHCYHVLAMADVRVSTMSKLLEWPSVWSSLIY